MKYTEYILPNCFTQVGSIHIGMVEGVQLKEITRSSFIQSLANGVQADNLHSIG